MKSKKTIKLFLFILIAINLSHCKKEEPQLGSIQGIIISENNETLSGVSINLYTNTQDQTNETKITDSYGRYKFNELSIGQYRISVSKSGYKSQDFSNITVKAGEITKKDITLLIDEQLGNIQGRIIDAYSSEPINGASVKITNIADATNETKTTASDGSYSFTNLTIGEYNIFVNKSGYASNKADNVEVKVEETTTTDITLSPIPAEFKVSHYSIDFEDFLTSQTVDITNLSTSKLFWSVIENCNWLHANPTAGETLTESDPVNLSVDRTGMKPGAYSNSIAVVSNGGSANIDIRMIVGETNLPLLYVSTMHLDFNQDQISLPIDIKNEGSESLEWSVVENVNWININPISGTTTSETDNFEITVDKAGLQTGTYAQNVIVNSNGGSATILVNMFVGEIANTGYAITRHATNVNNTSAMLNGIVTPDNQETIVLFEYGTSESYGNQILATQSPVKGNTDTDVNVNLTGLQENTTYHYRIKIQNTNETFYGVDMIFTTFINAQTSTVSTENANSITQTTATINGLVNANDNETTVTFEYGTTVSYGNTINAIPYIVSGSSNTNTSANLKGLTANTTYHYRVRAVNSGGTSYGNDIVFTTNEITSVTDIDGNVYDVVVIGNLYWMAENFKCTKLDNGTPITDGATVGGLSTGNTSMYYFSYDNNNNNISGHGRLYTYNAAKNICPTGWRLATRADFESLISIYGGSLYAYSAIIQNGISGFNARLSGSRSYAGSFNLINEQDNFWMNEQPVGDEVMRFNIVGESESVGFGNTFISNGHSVRCVKDK